MLSLRRSCTATDKRKNGRMRTLVIGDIHGCTNALHRLLDVVRPTHDDILITLGDYVDRGPDSRGVIDTLIQLESQTQLKPLIGNHEILFLDVLARKIDPLGWLRVGGSETMQSYAPPENKHDIAWQHVPQEHIDFLQNRCLRHFEDEQHLYVHANANAYFSLPDQSDDWLFWTRFDDAFPHVSGKKMICGHTAQKSGLPMIKPFAICIDTWAYGSGWLSCLDVTSGKIIQANQAGEIRHLDLNDLPQEPVTVTMTSLSKQQA